MASRRGLIGWLGLLCSLTVGARFTPAQETDLNPLPSLGQRTNQPALTARGGIAPGFPVDDVPEGFRARVCQLMDRPTLRIQGPLEAFTCQPQRYFWLLDHPDLTVRLWRALGAKVTEIESLGEGRFCWQDGSGSKVVWDTVLRSDTHRVWYAEGKVKPSVVLPTVAVKALLVVRHTEGSDGKGKPAIQHQVQLVLQTDNQAIALAARLLGASAPHVAEQYVEQIEMFYGAMAWYLDQHPKHAEQLLSQLERRASRK